MKKVFLGRPVFWLLWAIIITALWVMGTNHLHVTRINLFLVLLLGLTTACILFVVLAYRKGEAITREPFDESNTTDS